MTIGWRVLAALGRRETPAANPTSSGPDGTVLATVMTLESLREHNPLYDYQGLTMYHSLVMGPLIIIAADLAARREHRAGTRVGRGVSYSWPA